VSSDFGRVCRENLCGGFEGGETDVLIVASCTGFCLIGGDFRGSFLGVLKYACSLLPSTCCGGSVILCFGFGFTGGGVCVLTLCRGASSFGSGGNLNARCGFGDRTGGGEFWVTRIGAEGLVGVLGRACSNILTSEFVGGIGVSSVGLCGDSGCRALLTAECDSRLPLLLRGCWLGFLDSSLASTFPTLPEGGSTSLSFGWCSLMVGGTAAWGRGRRGLCRAAASRAAIFEGEETRSGWSSGTLSELELFDLDRFGLLTPTDPPVWWLRKDAGLPVPTLVAASKAPLSPPVYVFTKGFDLAGDLEKAFAAPRSAASRTLCWVSPAVCGTQPWLRAELI